MSDIAFEEMLQQKNREAEELFGNRLEKWLTSVTELYNTLRQWLQPYIDRKLILVEQKGIHINEEIGEYSIDELILHIGQEVIIIRPLGSVIFGGVGRLDVIGKMGRFSLIQTQWNVWYWGRNAVVPKNMWQLTEESLKDVIQELIA